MLCPVFHDGRSFAGWRASTSPNVGENSTQNYCPERGRPSSGPVPDAAVETGRGRRGAGTIEEQFVHPLFRRMPGLDLKWGIASNNV